MGKRILMVCLGNICRSPTAEAVLRSRAVARGIALTVDSVGTGDWHIGHPPHGPMQDAARARGYDLSPLRARQITGEDFHRFDLILAMDRQNRRDIEALRPPGAETPVALFLQAGGQDIADMPDPYFTGGFDRVMDLVEAAADVLLNDLDQARQ